MRKSEPHSEAGNPSGPRAGKGHNPVSRRAAIAAKARTNSKEQFNNLLHHLTYELVEECLDEIPRSSAAGMDGMSAKQARENLSWLLPPILKQIHEGRYTPPPVRRVYIPKADGSKRPIGIPAVIDRALQGAMAKVLNEIYEQDFLKCSFGFRQGLGCHHALATVNEVLYRQRMEHVLEVDIRDLNTTGIGSIRASFGPPGCGFEDCPIGVGADKNEGACDEQDDQRQNCHAVIAVDVCHEPEHQRSDP